MIRTIVLFINNIMLFLNVQYKHLYNTFKKYYQLEIYYLHNLEISDNKIHSTE